MPADGTVLIQRARARVAYPLGVTGLRRGERAALNPEGTTIGRGGDSDVALDDPTVSLEQAKARLEDGAWFVWDLAAVNRTAVAGQPVDRHRLTDGDRLTFGETEMVF